ncbi:MAG: hypothetical protein QXT53_00490 [Ignisphaera sp.]
MGLEEIRQSLEMLSNRDDVDADALYNLYVEFIKEVSTKIDSRFKDVEKWDIETLDEAVELICDYLNGSSKVLDVWDSIWDAKIDKRKISKNVVMDFLYIVKLAERMYGF